MNRKKITELIEQLGHQQKEEYSARICQTLISLIDTEWAAIDTYLCFYPMSTEPNLLPVYEYLLKKCKHIYFPVTHEDCTMDFYKVHDLSNFREAAFHVMEPTYQTSDCRYLATTECVCFTPCVIFDINCNRVGHGKGFYDRFFASHSGSIKKAGVAFHVQVLDTLNPNPWDIPLDILITETQCLS